MIVGIDASRANRDAKTGVEWYSYYIIQELKKTIPSFIKTSAFAKAPEDRSDGKPDSIRVFLYTDKKLKGELAEMPPSWREKVLCWPFNFLWTQGRLSLEMFFNPPDILFVPSSAIPFICPKKTFTTIHDVGFAKFPEFYGFFQRLYLNFSTRFAVKKCAKIFVPSEFTKKDILENFSLPHLSSPSRGEGEGGGGGNILANKIVVTPLGVVAQEATYSMCHSRDLSAEALAKVESGNPDFDAILADRYILFIGRLSEKKNIPRIIEAFQLFKNENPNSNLKLILVGSSKNESVSSVIKKSAGNIIHFDWLPPKEISQLLSKAKALIFPSLYEGFGLPILEAFAAGTPVITSKGIATEEVARLRSDLAGTSARQAGHAAILVNPLSVVEIKDAIFKITSDNALRQNLIQKGSERVKDFSWNKTAEITWESIKECLK